MSLLDRFAEAVSPEWGLRRARARRAISVLNAGYSHHGASTTKKAMQGWVTETGGPDSDIVENLPKLRERCRDLFMGDGLARGALRTIRTNEIGSGLRLNAQIDRDLLGLTPEQATAWEDTVEREFSLWANTTACDAQRRSTFGELQALARLSQLMSGDVFALLPMIDRGDRYELRVQLLESDMVEDPATKPANKDIVGGVEVDAFGAPVAYYFSKNHPGETLRSLRLVEQHTRIPAFGARTGRRMVLHLMESERPGQRRGVPLLAPVVETLKQLSRYRDAELMAAVVSACFTAVITTEAPEKMPGAAVSDTETPGTPETDATTYKLAPGTMFGLAPGEDVKELNPSRPNAGFDPFVLAVCRQVGAALGLPFELLVLHFTSSYSASRAALLEAWKHFKVGRAWTVSGFCQPIYEAWLEEAVARGHVVAPGFFEDPLVRAAWCGAEWIGPAQGQLDPVKEVTAATMRVAEGFSTRTREAQELTGGDWWAMNETRGREEEARKGAGLVAAPAAAPSTGDDEQADQQEAAA